MDLDDPFDTSDDISLSEPRANAKKAFIPIPAPYASNLPASEPSFFACQHCLKLLPSICFSKKSPNARAAKGQADQAPTTNTTTAAIASVCPGA